MLACNCCEKTHRSSHSQNGKLAGPKRLFLKEADFPGIVYSRTFGDVIGKQIGLVTEISSQNVKYDMEDLEFMIVGSWA